MLDQFTIATKGGVVLWNKEYTQMSGHPVNSLIQNELIPGARGGTEGSNKYTSGSYTMQWTFANELNVIFVAVYQKMLQLPYIEDLVRHVRRHFINRFEAEIKQLAGGGSGVGEFPDFGSFDEEFEQVWRAVEEREKRERQTRGGGTPRRFEDTRKFQATAKGAKQELDELAQAKDVAFGATSRRGGKMRTWDGRKTGSPATDDDDDKGKKKGKKSKEKRVWDDQVTKESMAALDYNRAGEEEDDASEARASGLVDERSRGTRTADGVYEVADVAESTASGNGFKLLDDKDMEDSSTTSSGGGGGGLLGMFRSLGSGRVLTAEILAEPMARMREHLANKNVAAEIAEQICQTVARGMVGVRVGGLQNVRQLVEQHMEAALTRILAPASSTDIMRDMDEARRQGRPYTMAFVGVNGVGKSTNLSKVCYWMLQNNKRVLIAACDTFRSGAVEQLRVHVRNLRALSANQSVEIFERGYGKDSATIARDAIAFGAAGGFDAVLIDTAGRMQDNEPLMRALAKLVSLNSPDKILFVGEALVGNEAVDQLHKFNRALRDFSGHARPRHIDGIILTKFDTIDDR
ncbi:hypothetical protein EV175_005916, partial [Coemansia sp. RSA 1933]